MMLGLTHSFDDKFINNTIHKALKYRGKTTILAFSYDNARVTCRLQKCVAFWESTDEPSLKGFLEFRLRTNDSEDKDTEHRRYKVELEIIKHHHCGNSELGAKVTSWLKQFKASVLVLFDWFDMYDTNYHAGCDWYWERLRLAVKRQNALAEINLFDVKSDLNEKRQDDLRDQICIEQAQHVLDATRETRSQSVLLQQTITKKRLLDESHDRIAPRTTPQVPRNLNSKKKVAESSDSDLEDVEECSDSDLEDVKESN
ncbi:1616_t:CDS:2, partial [Acaulospora colombiana]